MAIRRQISFSRRPLAMSVAIVLIGASLLAQRGGYGTREDNPRYTGEFTFARLKYVTGPGGYYYMGMPAWAHGFPQAEHNLMAIMGAISAIHPRINDSVVLSLDDPELFKYPVSYMTEAGYWTLNDTEAAAFGKYLRKGGFVIFDDFRGWPRGGGGWENFESNMLRVIPGAKFLPMDVSHPIFHSFFEIDCLENIRSYYDQGSPEFTGLYEDNDPKKRLMAIVNFNTDISNYWEFSGEGYRPVDESNEAYKLGVNYIIYALTH